MVELERWNGLGRALRDLHRSLVDQARRDYQRDHERMDVPPGELLHLLMTAPEFDWLRGLSELMVEIDAMRDDEPELLEGLTPNIRAAVERFITPPREGQAPNAFAQRYWHYLHQDPHVAMAHAAVKQALRGL